jgi:hypothetical protein
MAAAVALVGFKIGVLLLTACALVGLSTNLLLVR